MDDNGFSKRLTQISHCTDNCKKNEWRARVGAQCSADGKKRDDATLRVGLQIHLGHDASFGKVVKAIGDLVFLMQQRVFLLVRGGRFYRLVNIHLFCQCGRFCLRSTNMKMTTS